MAPGRFGAFSGRSGGRPERDVSEGPTADAETMVEGTRVERHVRFDTRRRRRRRDNRKSARTTRRLSDQSSSDARSRQVESRKKSFDIETLKNQHGSEQTKCDLRRNITMHHPIIPDRQGPTDRVSPNRHGDRSRSHNEKRSKKRIPKSTSGP